jgi:hypothetical protein
MLIDKYRLRELFGTRHSWNKLEVSIVSCQQTDYKDPPELRLFQIHSASKRTKEVLPQAIEQARSFLPIKVLSFRGAIPTELGNLLTTHLLELQKIYSMSHESKVETAAQKYADLVAWGEPNSAKVLARAEGISIRTMHSRLMNARKKGLLESPGSGFRFPTGV